MTHTPLADEGFALIARSRLPTRVTRCHGRTPPVVGLKSHVFDVGAAGVPPGAFVEKVVHRGVRPFLGIVLCILCIYDICTHIYIHTDTHTHTHTYIHTKLLTDALATLRERAET